MKRKYTQEQLDSLIDKPITILAFEEVSIPCYIHYANYDVGISITSIDKFHSESCLDTVDLKKDEWVACYHGPSSPKWKDIHQCISPVKFQEEFERLINLLINNSEITLYEWCNEVLPPDNFGCPFSK